MNNPKSYEFTFLYLINKCILLFKYIEIHDKKAILNEIKLFINKLQEIFSKADFRDSIEKKNKIFEINIRYHHNIIELIELCIKYDCLMSLGSNAHTTQEVGLIYNYLKKNYGKN